MMFSIFFALFIVVAQVSDAKVLYQNEASFRFQGKVYFLSDTENLYESVWRHHCAYGETLALKAAGFETSDFAASPRISRAQGKSLTLKLVRLLKILKLSSTQKTDEIAKTTPFEIDEATRKHCYGDYRERDSDLLKAEAFLKFRFNSGPRGSFSSNKKANMDSQDFVSFINSLDKQMPVELF
jgi:hypothetical protein